MSEKDLISVLIPVYNVEAYLDKCLNSIIRQDCSNYEIVLVDDGSTDNSSAICDMYANRYANISVIHKENGGLAAARNTALLHARGSLIAFIDSDDFVSTDYLSSMYENIIKYGVAIAACGRFIYSDETGSKEERRPYYARRVLNSDEALIALNSFRSFDMSMCSKLIRRELFEDVQFPEGKLCEDYYIAPILLLKACAVYYDDTPKYYYRHRSGSISRSSKINYAQIDASDAQLNLLTQWRPSLRRHAVTASCFARIAISNEYAKRGLEIPDDEGREFVAFVRRNISSILSNKDLPLVKKVQALCFALSGKIYHGIISMIYKMKSQ